MYNLEDIKILKDKFPDIDEEVKDMILDNIEPKREVIESVLSIIRDFIKNNNRIVYGGIAHNEVIKLKSPKDSFYGKNDYGDYDFYSPTPLEDIVKIANILHEKGYKDIYCREALHDETFSVTMNFKLYCDITYMPKYIFDNMPVKIIDEIKYIHPHVAIIDYLRMFTDPMFSSFRWEKALKRIRLLENLYPITKHKIIVKETSNNDDIMDKVFELLLRDTIIFIGDYAYNYYVEKANFKDFVPIIQYMVISTNYKTDANEIYRSLTKLFPITYKEYYNFFQFTGKCIEFSTNNKPILIIYDYNEVCTPYFKLNAINFHTKKILDNDILIAPFPLTILFLLIHGLYLFVKKNKLSVNYYNRVVDLIDIRNKYFKKNKKTIFDNTIFKEFNTKCTGKTITLQQKKKLIKDTKCKGHNRFSYDPDKDKSINTKHNYCNTSGNIINNPKDSIIIRKLDRTKKNKKNKKKSSK